MKHLTYILLALVLLVAGIFIWQSFTFTRLQGELERQTMSIARGYQSIVKTDVLPLTTKYALNDTEKKLMTDITQQTTTLQNTTNGMETRVAAITSLQIALNRFSTTAADSKNIAADPLYKELNTDIGKKGHIRTALDAYNATAIQWNRSVESDMGSLFNGIGGENRPILPYLRFDGQEEFVPIIKI